jgi:hypothetical protein
MTPTLRRSLGALIEFLASADDPEPEDRELLRWLEERYRAEPIDSPKGAAASRPAKQKRGRP